MRQAVARDVQTAGDSGTVISVRFNIAVLVLTVGILIFPVIKGMLFKLSSAVCGHRAMHLTHLQQALDLTQVLTVVNGAAALDGLAQCSPAAAAKVVLLLQTCAAIQHLVVAA